jgi:hypothetical protein
MTSRSTIALLGTGLLGSAIAELERAITLGLGDLDYSALFELVNPPTGRSTLS